ncbi:MAG: TraR/DksA family transcriptional regulator [Candidatus Methylomirabilales bacterium]
MAKQEALTRWIRKEQQALRTRLKRTAHGPTNGFSQLGERETDGIGDTLDRVQQEILEQQESKVYELLVTRARALDRAWKNLQRGSYGICQVCGQRIPRRRLDVVPHAVRCLSCQEKAEQAAGNVPARGGRGARKQRKERDHGMARE